MHTWTCLHIYTVLLEAICEMCAISSSMMDIKRFSELATSDSDPHYAQQVKLPSV